MEDWKKVIWSDGQHYVWKQRTEDFKERDIYKTVKFGGGKIMVWGCMGWDGTGILCEVEGKMDAK